MTDKLTWIDKILASQPDEKLRVKIADDNPQWEFIDGEMVKLGSLGHASLDLSQIQQSILVLLETESKDFRLLAHLLRTLQHGGQPQDILLAIQLLSAWIEQYWTVAWPDNKVMKRRLAQQVIKRFDAAVNVFLERADCQQHQETSIAFSRLAKSLPASEKALIKEINLLSARYRREPQRPAGATGMESAVNNSGEAAMPAVASSVDNPAPALDIDSHNDKAWRHTQLRMAEILCERYPDNPSGYALRRNAIWQGITSAPVAQDEGGRTLLAAFSADRMAEYQGKASSADHALWQQVEQSLTLAPYWFDGHALSAEIAHRLGCLRVARVICEELQLFLQRLPQLSHLTFNDRTPFLSASARAWLEEPVSEPEPPECSIPSRLSIAEINEEAVWQCWQQKGLEAALKLTDETAAQLNPRGQFYCQLLNARLLASSGLSALARQNYQQLYQIAQRITLPEWEPGLIAQLQLAQQQTHNQG